MPYQDIMLMNLFELSNEIIWMKLSKHAERIIRYLQKKKKFLSFDFEYLDGTEC